MSVAPKAGACVPCEVLCVGDASLKIKITKVFRLTVDRHNGPPEYMWQSNWAYDGETVIKNFQCNKKLTDKGKESIGEQLHATLSNELTSWRVEQGLDTQTTDPKWEPEIVKGRNCNNSGGCSINLGATAKMAFEVRAMIVKEECVDDPDAPLTSVEVTPAGEIEITVTGP